MAIPEILLSLKKKKKRERKKEREEEKVPYKKIAMLSKSNLQQGERSKFQISTKRSNRFTLPPAYAYPFHTHMHILIRFMTSFSMVQSFDFAKCVIQVCHSFILP